MLRARRSDDEGVPLFAVQPRRLGALIVVAWSVGAAVAVPAPDRAAAGAPPAPANPAVDWHLVGTGADGHSLEIHEHRKTRCGYDATIPPTVVRATRTRITLRIDVPPAKDPDPDNGASHCLAVLHPPSIVTVPVGVKVDGQVIDGPGREPAEPGWLRYGHELAAAEPGVVGLRVPDAVAVLRERGIAKAKITFDGPRRGRVTGQTPAPGERWSRRITLRTRGPIAP